MEPLQAPLWAQLAHQLRTRIRKRDLKPGERLPTEAELQDQHGVSRNTVRLALRQLSSEGLVEIKGRGQGNFVRDDQQLTFNATTLDVTPLGDVGPLDLWEDAVREKGRSPGTELLSVAVEHPPEHVVKLLGLSEGEMTVVRRRLRSIDNQPWELVTSYFPETLIQNHPRAETLLQNRVVDVSGGVLKEIDHAPCTWDDEIRSRMPTPEEAAQLNIPSGVPVIDHRRTVKDSAGERDHVCSADERIHVLVNILPGDRHVLAYRGLDATPQDSPGL